jgi:hypothetical protein
VPPAANGTSILIGWSGQAAALERPVSEIAMIDAMNLTIFFLRGLCIQASA